MNSFMKKVAFLLVASMAGCVAETDADESQQPYDDEEEVLGTSQAIEASPTVVISQIYPAPSAGGPAGMPYNQEFVELFNRGDHAISLANWSVQYAASAGAFGCNGGCMTLLPNITLQPGQYLLISGYKDPYSTSPNLPTPNVVGKVDMSKYGGKLALVKAAPSLNCGSTTVPCTSAQMASIVDLISWGSTTRVPSLFEGTGYAAEPGNTNAVWRSFNGCLDTNDNKFDTVVQAPAPRTMASARNLLCFNLGTTP